MHAGPVHRSWTRTVAELERGRAEAIETALLAGHEDAGGAWGRKPVMRNQDVGRNT